MDQNLRLLVIFYTKFQAFFTKVLSLQIFPGFGIVKFQVFK